MLVVHLAASPFVGGPESQILGLIRHLPDRYQSAVLSFSEGGRCRALLEAASAVSAVAIELRHNTPHFCAAVSELAEHLRWLGAGVVCCHGYKPDLLGLFAARRARVPVISISHGWTAATWKVRLNEALDRAALHMMDRIICVSDGQARRVRRSGVPACKVSVIRNAIDLTKYGQADLSERDRILSRFPNRPHRVVGSAGRLSPEKGYSVLAQAAADVLRADPNTGFIHFGDGPLRSAIAAQIRTLDLEGRFVLAGFETEIHKVYPCLDLVVLPSFTEGLPVVVLEAFAASVPVVATAVGGTPEVVVEGHNGRLVPPGDSAALARRISETLADDRTRRFLGENGRRLVEERFTFASQSLLYQYVFDTLRQPRSRRRSSAIAEPVSWR
jgi:glycosyltransferase involved in cell wall biosynthesis